MIKLDAVARGALVLAVLIGPAATRAEGLKVAIFAIEPVGLAKTARTETLLATYTDQLRKLFAERGFSVIDLAPQARKIADNLPLSDCNGCDQDIAKALGAAIEVTTAMQQSSAAVYNLSGNVKDVTTNRVLRSGVVDIHGEGDDDWRHGVKFLVKERLDAPALPRDDAGLRKLVEGARGDER